MAGQSLGAERIGHVMAREPLLRLVAQHDWEMTEQDRAMAPARGIMLAVLLSLPFWALLAFALLRFL